MTERKGCRTVVWIVMVASAIGLSASGFFGCFAPNRVGDTGQNDPLIAVIDGQDLTQVQLNRNIEEARKQFGQFGPLNDPFFDYQILAAAIRTSVAQRVITALATSRGLALTDDQVVAMASTEIDNALTQFRAQAQAGGELKAGATEQEFQEYFKSKQGATTSDFKNSRLEDLKESLTEPNRRSAIVAAYFQQILQNDYFTKTLVTDEEVKKSYDVYLVKSIVFDKAGLSEDQRKKDADAALAEINGGGDFDSVAKKHMTAPAKDPARFGRASIDSNEALKPILALKPGETSAVTIAFGTPRIFRLVEIKSEVPEDFEASKTLYTDTYRRQKATQDMQATLTKGIDEAKIEWKSPGYGLVHRLAMASAKPDSPAETVKSELKAIIATAPDLVNDLVGVHPARLARYMAAQQLESMLEGDEKTAFLATKAEVVLDLLTTSESTDLRLELVEIYDQTKNTQAMIDALKTAALNNTGFEPQNVDAFNRIHEKIVKLETDKKIDATAAQEIRTILNDWSARKLEVDTAQQEATKELDQFTIDPATGKPKADAAKEAADAALKKANEEPGG